LLITLASLFGSALACAPKRVAAPTDELVIESASGAHRFDVEIADDDQERALGLMYRTSLPENGGMLFDFTHDVSEHSMWMKNTLIPLDIAFIAADGTIVRIAAMTTPRSLQSISSGAPVAAVLEVNGGRFEALGVKAGDRVRHPLFAGG
jgi:hypothetical protein